MSLTEVPEVAAVRTALREGAQLSEQWSKPEAHQILKRLIPKGHLLEAKQIVQGFDMLGDLRLKTLLKLYRHARRTGYVGYSTDIAAEVAQRTGEDADLYRASKTQSDLAFLRNPWSQLPELPGGDYRDAAGPVLHIVAKSYPETTTGYAVRTKHTAEALAERGIGSVLAVPSGGNVGVEVEQTLEREENGIRTVLLGGPALKNTTRFEWLERNTDALHRLVTRMRPRAIHAHSDYVNGVLASHVGEATGVPVVYEVRGFWEETWLAGLETAQEWENPDEALRLYGTPDAYRFRRENERKVRERADHVITLARTMRDHITAESNAAQLSEADVTVVPNAVVPEDFPMPSGVSPARATHGIDPTDITIGYISSITEYEGIETLLDAFGLLKSRPSALRVHLLIVGDGPTLEKLQEYAAQLGLQQVTFTGRIPHEEITDYYHAIDIFVVPRRRTRVTELVTPLKPFEALATGRTLVLSDLPALREIAADAGDRARTFIPGDAHDLARTLAEATESSDGSVRPDEASAAWVRRHRTWERNGTLCARVYQSL